MSWLEDYWDWQKVYWREAPKKLHRKQETMNEDFKWTDELVAEFAEYYRKKQGIDYTTWGKCLLDCFKKEQSKLNSSNKDWEIVERYNFCGVTYDGDVAPIKSVRRLSDGEVFSVGDNCLQGEIKRFEVGTWNNSMHVCFEDGGVRCRFYLSEIKKAKQPLFTTEDGKDVFEGDKVFWVNTTTESYWGIYLDGASECYDKSSQVKYFSTEESAKEYVVNNKPVLSYNDIYDLVKCWYVGESSIDNHYGYIYKEKLKQLVEKKINDNTL